MKTLSNAQLVTATGGIAPQSTSAGCIGCTQPPIGSNPWDKLFPQGPTVGRPQPLPRIPGMPDTRNKWERLLGR